MKKFSTLEEVVKHYCPERYKEIKERGHPILCKCRECSPSLRDLLEKENIRCDQLEALDE